MISLFLRAWLVAYLAFTPFAWADGQGRASTSVRAPIPDSAMANPNAWNVVRPTGTSDDKPMLQAALNNAAQRPVWLMPGSYQVCSGGLTIPANGVLASSAIGSSWTTGAGSQPNGGVIRCDGSWGFDGSRPGFVKMSDRSTIKGVAINGLFTTAPYVSCIDSRNVSEVTIENNQLIACAAGIDASPNGGHVGSLVVRHNFFMNTLYGGYFADCTINGGGWVADLRFHDNNLAFANKISDTMGGVGGMFYAECLSVSQINNNRFEDFGRCLVLKSSGALTITGNLFDRCSESSIVFENSNNIVISENRFGGLPTGEGGPSPVMIEFAGSNTQYNLYFGANDYGYNANHLFLVSGAGGVGGGILWTFGGFYQTLFADAHTRDILAPILMGNQFIDNSFTEQTLTGTAFAAANLSYHRNYSYTLDTGCSPCTIPNAVNITDGQTGTFRIKQPTVGSKTVTWGASYSGTIPTLTTTGDSSDIVPYIVANSQILLLPKTSVAPPANLLAGGNTMPSANWGPSHLTMATNVGTSPFGAGDASSVTEDAVNVQHSIIQPFADPGAPITCFMYIHPGTSGARNIQMETFNSAFNSEAVAGWNPSTGASIGTLTGGSGSVTNVSSSNAGLSSGWWKVQATFQHTATDQSYISMYMLNGGSVDYFPSYAGDGASNIWIWGANCHAGTS